MSKIGLKIIFIFGALMFNFEKLTSKEIDSSLGEFVLVSDIGGTNAGFAIAQLKKEKPELIISFRIDSKSISSFVDVINNILSQIKKDYGIEITKAALAIAGPVAADKMSGKITNLNVDFNARQILDSTPLKSVKFLNDFEAVGYGLQILDEKFLIKINDQKINEKYHNNKVYLGAGTGLGVGFLIWNDHKNFYIPIASEGGHSNFAVQNQEELDLVNFIKKNRNSSKTQMVEWEDILSGEGLQNIYKFLWQTGKFYESKCFSEIEKSGYLPELISKYKNEDDLCGQTFKLFTKFYARCAKCFALDCLARGSVYIAGGIAAKNLDIFQPCHPELVSGSNPSIFLNEFVDSYKQKDLLSKIPIFVITDHKVGLLGSAVFLFLDSSD